MTSSNGIPALSGEDSINTNTFVGTLSRSMLSDHFPYEFRISLILHPVHKPGELYSKEERGLTRALRVEFSIFQCPIDASLPTISNPLWSRTLILLPDLFCCTVMMSSPATALKFKYEAFFSQPKQLKYHNRR